MPTVLTPQRCFGVATLLIFLVGASPAFAQAPAQRPFRGLFGGSAVDPSVHHNLDLTVSVMEAYDDNVLADAGGGSLSPSSALQASGYYTGLSAGMSYAWRGKRVRLGANGGTDTRYYRDRQELTGVSHFGAFGVEAEFARRTRLFINQSINYSPSYFFSLLSGFGAPAVGDVIGGGSDYSLADLHARVFDTSVSLSHGITSRASLELISSFRDSNFTNASVDRDLRAYGIGGRYLQTLTRNATLRVGYVYREGQYGLIGTRPGTALHDIDAGVDYRRALSLTRRTTLDFNVGSTIINAPLQGSESAALQYRVVGNAGLNREIGRTWRATVGYNRGVGFVEGFGQPVFSDTLNASLNGFFSRRVDFSAIGGLSVGDVGLASSQSGFRTYTASSRVRVAVSSMVALSAEYLYYYYDIGGAVAVPAGVPSSLARNSARVGVSFWLPLLGR